MRRRSGNKNKGDAHNRFKHGMTGTSTYKSWTGMKRRCYATHSTDYKNYGARGIRVCERWHSFENFLADMGVKPAGKTIERLDNNKDYGPENCCWADKVVQGRNRRSVRLSMDAAEEIRADRAKGHTLEKIAAAHGISISHAHRVVTGESWS